MYNEKDIPINAIDFFARGYIKNQTNLFGKCALTAYAEAREEDTKLKKKKNLRTLFVK